MNLSALRAQVKDHGYNDISDGEVNAAINVAYLEVCGADSWPFLEDGPTGLAINPTTRFGLLSALYGDSGQQTNVPISRVLGVNYQGTELGAMSPDDYFASAHSLAAGTATPTHYTVYGDKLFVTPMPTGGVTVSVRFRKQPVEISGDSSVPAFPSRYHQLVVYGAVAVLAGEDDDDGVQARFRGLLEKGLEQMKADLMIKSEGRTSPYGTQGSLNYWADRVRSAGFPKATNADVAVLLQDTISDICSRYAWPFLRVDTTLTTVPGQDYVTLPTDFSRSLGIYLPELGTQVHYSSLADTRFDFHPEISVPSASQWTAQKSYTSAETVLYNGIYYVALANSTNVAPGTDPTKWSVFTPTEKTGSPERYSISWAAPGTTTYPNRGARLVLWPVPSQAFSLKIQYERRIAVNTASADAPIEWPGPGMILELGVLYRLAMRSNDKDGAARLPLFKNEYEEAITRMRNDAMIEQRDRDPVVRITQTDLWDY